MRLIILLVFSIVLCSPAVHAQNLLKERIWKISERKRSIFFDKGIFHSGANSKMQNLKGIRNSYVPSRGYERVVFDFTGKLPPRIYGHISKTDKKVYIDFFNTELSSELNNLKNTKYLTDIQFFNIEQDHVSVELVFKANVSFDVFYLENPARLVVDIKK